MLHSPCSTISALVYAVSDLQEFRDKTQENVNGYPKYKSKEGPTVKIGKYDMEYTL
jgi:hypothetical protein